jgi:hypothetical protein
MLRLAASVALLVLTGCASIITGTSQQISVATTPTGAKCVVSRQGQSIAVVQPTPGVATVQKDKHDILITCDKDGYQTANEYVHSGVEAGTFGNIILGGVIGWGVDSATGADNKYTETVMVSMMPAPVTPASTASSTQPASLPTGTVATAQQAPIAYVRCRLKDGTIVALQAGDCVAKGGANF